MRAYNKFISHVLHDDKEEKSVVDESGSDAIDSLPCELNRKLIAEAFWTAECEAELRETKKIDHHFKRQEDREKLMDTIDRERASTTYSHTQCSEECKKRGQIILVTFCITGLKCFAICVTRNVAGWLIWHEVMPICSAVSDTPKCHKIA